jgi:hypothetical protein
MYDTVKSYRYSVVEILCDSRLEIHEQETMETPSLALQAITCSIVVQNTGFKLEYLVKDGMVFWDLHIPCGFGKDRLKVLLVCWLSSLPCVIHHPPQDLHA